MQMAPHITAIQADLAAAASLGDEATAEAARRVSEAVGTSLHLRLLDLLGEAALDVNAQLPSGHVEVRLAGREPELVYVAEPDASAEPQPAADDQSARITLRLPEALKTAVEAAADREGVSTNTWIVRALSRALEPRGADPPPHRKPSPGLCPELSRERSSHGYLSSPFRARRTPRCSVAASRPERDEADRHQARASARPAERPAPEPA